MKLVGAIDRPGTIHYPYWMTTAQRANVASCAKAGRVWWAINDGCTTGWSDVTARAVGECHRAIAQPGVQFIVREYE
jgi:hypothetical protein